MKNFFEKVTIKGNISLIKHCDDGETGIDTPEAGAQFEIYLKSSGSFDAAADSERDLLVCDEYGYAESKDLHYGTYTVHQVSGWDGRELMPDFDVYISNDGQTYRFLINNAVFESYIKVVKVDSETGPTSCSGAAFLHSFSLIFWDFFDTLIFNAGSARAQSVLNSYAN